MIFSKKKKKLLSLLLFIHCIFIDFLLLIYFAQFVFLPRFLVLILGSFVTLYFLFYIFEFIGFLPFRLAQRFSNEMTDYFVTIQMNKAVHFQCPQKITSQEIWVFRPTEVSVKIGPIIMHVIFKNIAFNISIPITSLR